MTPRRGVSSEAPALFSLDLAIFGLELPKRGQLFCFWVGLHDESIYWSRHAAHRLSLRRAPRARAFGASRCLAATRAMTGKVRRSITCTAKSRSGTDPTQMVSPTGRASPCSVLTRTRPLVARLTRGWGVGTVLTWWKLPHISTSMIEDTELSSVRHGRGLDKGRNLKSSKGRCHLGPAPSGLPRDERGGARARRRVHVPAAGPRGAERHQPGRAGRQ